MDALAPGFELSTLVAAGDLRRAGEWLVARHARDVISLCRSMLRERELAEDVAQDVFAQAFTHLRGYRGEASPRTWLLAIARNRCIDQLRRSQREPWDDAGEGGEPDEHADDAPLPAELLVRRDDVDAALSELAEGERALIVLRFRLGLEYPELALVFGLREGTVRMRLSRALAKMRDRLELRDQVVGAPSYELDEAVMPAARGRAAGSAAHLLPPPAPAAFASPEEAAGSDAPTGAPVPLAGAPLPPTGAPPPPIMRAGSARASAVPAAGEAPARRKGGGLLERVKDFLGRPSESGSGGAPSVRASAAPLPLAGVASTPFALALAPEDDEPSASFGEKLLRLMAGLPGR